MKKVLSTLISLMFIAGTSFATDKLIVKDPNEKTGPKILSALKKFDNSLKKGMYSTKLITLNKESQCENPIIFLNGLSGYCGSEGCTLLVLDCTDAGYKVMGKTSVLNSPILLSSDSNNGYKNIKVRSKTSGIVTLKYNGKAYTKNASTAAKSKKVSSDIIIFDEIAIKPSSQALTPTTPVDRGKDAVSYTENFYKAVNKQWFKKNKIDPKYGSVSNFSLIINDVNKQLKDLIEKLDKSDKLTSDEQKIIDLYRSYMDVEYRNKLGIAPLTKGLEAIREAKTHKDIDTLFSKLFLQGVSTPLLILPKIDKKDSTRYILTAMQSGISLTQETYLDGSKRHAEELQYYKEYLTDKFKLARFDNIEKRVDDVLKVETELAKIQLSILEKRATQKIYSVVDFKKFSTTLSNLNMEQYFEINNIRKDLPIGMEQAKYFTAFNSLFLKIEVETWKNYLEANYLNNFAGLTLTAFSDIKFEYMKKLGLTKKQPEMWEKGLKKVNDSMGMLLGKLYIKEYFDEKSKTKTNEIIKAIIEQYKETITASKLFQEATKKRAMQKINSMKFNVGYPDKWQDYSSVMIDKKDFFGNMQRISDYELARFMIKPDKPVDHNEWGKLPQNVNAFYSPPENKFVILAAILNKPLFDLDATDAQNYGAVGMVVGHEIGHGFDDNGSRYDYQGNLVDWWEKEDRVKYAKRAENLISQADHFEYLPGKHLNGHLEVGEIIGDLNGVTVALAAYEKVIKEKGLDRKASLKAFFIQLAKVWRNKTKPHNLEQIVHTDTHPVSEFRVNGVLKNVDTFHEIFETKKGDKMYMAPEDRVKLW